MVVLRIAYQLHIVFSHKIIGKRSSRMLGSVGKEVRPTHERVAEPKPKEVGAETVVAVILL
jgi:hypothetical protein